jgi:hypothetical protein
MKILLNQRRLLGGVPGFLGGGRIGLTAIGTAATFSVGAGVDKTGASPELRTGIPKADRITVLWAGMMYTAPLFSERVVEEELVVILSPAMTSQTGTTGPPTVTRPIWTGATAST